MPHHPTLIMLGVTGDMAFAAGCLLLALRRHSPTLPADIRLYTDEAMPNADATLLRGLGAELHACPAIPGDFDADAIRRYSYLSLVRFEGFRLLEQYRTVLWLDADIAIQGDISPLLDYGPFAMAREDPAAYPPQSRPKAGGSLIRPVPGFDPEMRSFNSGVLVLQNTLPGPMALHAMCMAWMQRFGAHFRFIDQGILNMLLQHLMQRAPEQVAVIPHDRFNAHPRNPGAHLAELVHAFGPYKFWEDGRLPGVFPEWARDYARWLAMGGTGWQGAVRHADAMNEGPLGLLGRLT